MPFSPILQSRCLGLTLTSLTRPDTLSSWNFEDMLDTIEKLLILQDRDRKIRRVRGELTHIEPERQALQAEAGQREVVRATQAAADAKKLVEEQLTALASREVNLKKEMSELLANREELAGAVDDSARGRYERLVKNKGENVVVGIQHGVC